MSRLVRLPLWILALALGAGSLGPGSLAAQDSRSDFALESRLLDQELRYYADARKRENEAIQEFRTLADRVSAELLDPNAALPTLRDLEARLSLARESAYLRSKESGEARIRIYERMERLTELAQAVETNNPSSLAGSDGPSGLWQIDLEPIKAYGLMKLDVQGQLVTGSYRLSNGNRGSLKGTWTGDGLVLDVIHSERGLVGTLEGELDRSRDELQGRWNAMELGAGEPAAGSWQATMVTDDPSLQLDQ